MSSEKEENRRGAAVAAMGPTGLLKILLSHVRAYSSRAVILVLTLLVEGVFNVLLIGGGSYLAFAGSLSIGSLVSFNALFITVSTAVMGLTAVTPSTFLVLQREQLQNLMRRHEGLRLQVRQALEIRIPQSHHS